MQFRFENHVLDADRRELRRGSKLVAVEPQVFGPGRMIEQEGSMIIWITDDARRIPVRAQVNSPIGRVEIKLKSAENLK